MSTNLEKQFLGPIESTALIYLVIPLFIFFAGFIRVWIAIPACALIAFNVYEIVRRTRWRAVRGEFSSQSLWLLIFSSVWVAWLFGAGPLNQNGDWIKHYAVLNALIDNPWPPETYIDGIGDATLRYYVGWHLVPALAVKLTGASIQHLALGAWSVVGVFLFLQLLHKEVGTPRFVLIAAFAFALFGGADLIGELLLVSTFDHLSLRDPTWAGWILYGSNTLSIAWVPYHAISGWLGAVLLMSESSRGPLRPFIALMTCGVLLWSPFSAIGLIPLLCVWLARVGLRSVLADWRVSASVVLLAAPVGLYLTSTADFGHGFIGSNPCGPFSHERCFTWSSYGLFILVEIAAPILVLFLGRRFLQKSDLGFLAAAAIALTLIPLYKMGINNDFAMRASIPSISVLAILCAKLLVRSSPRLKSAVTVILIAALPGVYAEVARPLPSSAGHGVSPTSTFADAFGTSRPFLLLYFSTSRPWILR